MLRRMFYFSLSSTWESIYKSIQLSIVLFFADTDTKNIIQQLTYYLLEAKEAFCLILLF